MRRVSTLIAGMLLVVLLGLSADALAQSGQVNVSVTLLDGTTTPAPTATTEPTATIAPTQIPPTAVSAVPVTSLPVTGSGPADYPLSGIVIPMVTLLAGCVVLVAIEAGRRERRA